ncbi:MAG: MFS transporter, partial [Candidatus Altiarchaeota archaeon]|nr:MFS transporter [Candidatus Altiarchaeota archaeon]
VITDISVNRQRGGISGVWTLFMDFAYVVGPIFGGAIAFVSGDVSSIFLITGILMIIAILPITLLSKHTKGL